MHAKRNGRGLNFMAPIAALAAAASFSPAAASPWARQSGDLFVSSRADYFLARASKPAAPSLEAARFERFETNTYAELGLARTITIGGKVVYGTSNFFDGTTLSSASGFSEIEGFVQFEALRGRLGALSVKLAGAAPSRFEAGARPQLTNDGVDAEARILHGRTLALSPFKVFAAAEAGYRKRFGDAADQIRADLLIGMEPTRRLTVLVEVLSSTSLRNETAGGGDYDVVKIQPSAVWRASRRYWLQAGMTHEAAGRNLLLGDTYFIGLWSVF